MSIRDKVIKVVNLMNRKLIRLFTLRYLWRRHGSDLNNRKLGLNQPIGSWSAANKKRSTLITCASIDFFRYRRKNK